MVDIPVVLGKHGFTQTMISSKAVRSAYIESSIFYRLSEAHLLVYFYPQINLIQKFSVLLFGEI